MKNILKKENIPNIILLILSVLISLIPFVILPVCPVMPNGNYMNCYYTGKLVTILGIILIIISLSLIFIKCKKLKIFIYLLASLVSLFIHLIPHRIIKIQFAYNNLKNMPRYFGYCSKETMKCVLHKTFIFSSTFTFLILFLCIFCIIFNLIKKEGKNEKN